MNAVIAGLIAAVPLSFLGLVYMWSRGKFLVGVILEGSDPTQVSAGQMLTFMTYSFILAPFAFGVVAGLVFQWLQSPERFLAVALGLALVFSSAAVTTKGPLKVEKIVMNFLVALNFGLLLPLLTGS